MKRGFIRALWGIPDSSHRITKRRFRVNKNIQFIKDSKFNQPFKTYVMGRDNYEGLKELGFDCELIYEEPSKFDLIKHQYRHKLEIIKHAMEVDGYDELVYMDWDCFPQKQLPNSFWDEMGKKEVFQATLQMYHRRKAYWRDEELRKVPNGGFIYLRDKTLPQKAIELWGKLGKGDNDEPAWAKLTDDIAGGWKGIEKYWELFEPMFCNLHRSSPYTPEKLATKNVCFIHYQGGR
ncbi:MAG: hypothetical protein WC119_02195 [Synergistaceae bacterium]